MLLELRNDNFGWNFYCFYNKWATATTTLLNKSVDLRQKCDGLLPIELGFLAHLNWRLMAYSIGRHPSSVRRRRPSVNIFKRHLLWSHEADSYYISHKASIGRENEYYCFCPNLIRTLVARASSNCHWLIMGKMKLAFTANSLQIFWQNFYRNVPWVVLYQTYHFVLTS